MLETIFVSYLIVLCLATVLPVIFIKSKSWARKLSLLLTSISSITLVLISLGAIWYNTDEKFLIYSILPLLEFSVKIDRLSGLFLLIIGVISFCVSVYSLSYLEHYNSPSKRNMIVSLMNLFILSMVLVVASYNIFSFLFFWEAMSISSFFMVMTDYEKAETAKSAVFYFIMTQLSTVFLFLGLLAISATTGSLAISKMGNITDNQNALIFLCLFIGFAIKAGAIPFHKWLPYAHSAAPSNISALMSGVMIKVAIYGLIRFVVDVLNPQLWWGITILIMGSISAILGVIYALKEHDIKRLLAYHSIENIGIILIGFGLYIMFTFYGLTALATLSLLASLFHTFNHAVFKSLLFLGAGSVINATGTRNIEEMGGLIKNMPYTATFFLIGSISISGLPPFNGFVSELMIFQSFMQSSFVAINPYVKLLLFFCLSMFALTSALAAACFVKAFGITFLAMPRSEKAKSAKEAKFPMLSGQAILAIICVLLGVFSYQIFSALGYNLPIPNMLTVSLIMLVFAVLVIVMIKLLDGTKNRTSETWGCGITSQNSNMEYTASGFSEPIITIFKPIYQTRKTNERRFFDKYSAIFKSGQAEIHLIKFFEEYLYAPVAKFISSISLFISKFQKSIEPDSYLVHMFIASIIMLIIGWWFL